jgi:single-strand DNA-binding protein
LSKGHGVIIDGRLQQRRWETDDGQKRSKHEVVAQTVNYLPKRILGCRRCGGRHGRDRYQAVSGRRRDPRRRVCRERRAVLMR